MLTIKTWCLPNDMSEEDIEELHNAIVSAVVSIPQTGVKDESDMLNLFPSDLMSYGLGTEISVEITKVPISDDNIVYKKLAAKVGYAVQKMFSSAHVECEALPINEKAEHWSFHGPENLIHESKEK